MRVAAAVERGEGAEHRVEREVDAADGVQREERHGHRDAGPEGDAVGAGVRAELDETAGVGQQTGGDGVAFR
ncbi:hypothetical protein GCM10017602_05450 [Herbiconiux flava]|nr:hypothetical protein GCM10017602_05450 [Herbiconiux flava]